MDTSPRTALVDESFRRGSDGRGYYLMAAAVIPDVHHAAIIQGLRAMLPRGQRRWHFTDESDASRHKFMSKIAELHGLEVVAVAVVQETPDQRKAEQARVRCLWGLLTALDASGGVDTLVLESRQERQDRNDRREIENIKRSGVLGSAVYRHDRPMEEPLLWLPDAIAGTVGVHVALNDDGLLDRLPEGMCEVRWV